ncbi:MAG: glycosyltransferase family 4 protein [Pseudomonadota bacterium]|nr:glycosyltransferase family 4 protein [Pseudomonadota bacterium]
MRICLVCSEIFAWGKYGGFGRSTRMLGRELVKRGVQVVAVVPRRLGQQAEETLDGMRVLSFAPHKLGEAQRCYERAQCDIYHSQEASLGSYLAQRAAPLASHVISFRDHKFWADWLIEIAYPSQSRWRTVIAAVYERNPLMRRAVLRADRLLCVSPHLTQRIQRAYGLSAPPEFLGSPISIPAQVPHKSPTPLVCFVGRLDRRKRPERFIALAARFPKVEFVMAGEAQDAQYEATLRAKADGLSNLTMTGFLQQFDAPALEQLLERSWVLVNTSAREGLPTAMLEALAHRCALLSLVDVSGVAARFGHHAADGDLGSGLERLLGEGRWKDLGERGFEFVRTHFACNTVLTRHLALYELLGRRPQAAAITA